MFASMDLVLIVRTACERDPSLSGSGGGTLSVAALLLVLDILFELSLRFLALAQLP